jgi:Na+/melibiose symporter-like transporter
MGLDNFLGLIVEPIMGNLSDNTRTKIGRRMPYIIVCIPLAAIFFVLIPFESSLPTLMTYIILYVLVMLAAKAPVESLIPDFIVPEHRSKAMAIPKFLTSISIIFAALISELVVDVNLILAYAIPAVIMIIALVVFVTTVKEKNSYTYQLALKEAESGVSSVQQKSKVGFFKTLGAIFRSKDKSAVFMLFAIMMMGLSWSGMRGLLTLYGMNWLGLPEGEAGGFTLYGGIAYMLLVFPLAYLSEKINRLLFVRIGFLLFISGLIIGFLGGKNTIFIIIAIIFVSLSNALIAINGIVIIWNSAPSHHVTGTYTGLYYLFYYTASSLGPFLVGAMSDLTGISFMFLNAALFVIIGFVLMLYVKHE